MFFFRHPLLWLCCFASTLPFVGCADDKPASPYTVTESLFDAAARQDSTQYFEALDSAGRTAWGDRISKERVTYAVLGGIDFKVQPLAKHLDGDSGQVDVELTILKVREPRLQQTVRVGAIDTLRVHLHDEQGEWRVSSISR